MGVDRTAFQREDTFKYMGVYRAYKQKDLEDTYPFPPTIGYAG